MDSVESEENSQHISNILKTEVVTDLEHKNQYLCDGCNKSFDSPNQLHEHVENVHSGKIKTKRNAKKFNLPSLRLATDLVKLQYT